MTLCDTFDLITDPRELLTIKHHSILIYHVACFGSDVIHRSPVPANIRAIVTSTEILKPSRRQKNSRY